MNKVFLINELIAAELGVDAVNIKRLFEGEPVERIAFETEEEAAAIILLCAKSGLPVTYVSRETPKPETLRNFAQFVSFETFSAQLQREKESQIAQPTENEEAYMKMNQLFRDQEREPINFTDDKAEFEVNDENDDQADA